MPSLLNSIFNGFEVDTSPSTQLSTSRPLKILSKVLTDEHEYRRYRVTFILFNDSYVYLPNNSNIHNTKSNTNFLMTNIQKYKFLNGKHSKIQISKIQMNSFTPETIPHTWTHHTPPLPVFLKY